MADSKVQKNSPLTVYNTQTLQPEQLQSGEVEQAILGGTHDFQKGETINLVGPDGKTGGGVPSENLRKYLEAGYRLETPFEKEVNDYADENDNVGGALKTGARKFVNELGFGVPEVVEQHLENPLDLAKKQAADERNAGIGMVGSLAGAGGSLLYGGPLFKGAEVAGRALEKGIQSGLTKAIVNAGASEAIARKAATSLAGKIPGAAAKYAAEGAITVAPRALTEAAFGDIDAAGESLLMGAGINSVLGAAGSMVSPVARGMGGVYKKFIKNPVSGLADAEGGAVARGLGPDAAETALDSEIMQKSIKKSAILRDNADEINSISREFTGKDATPGMKSKNYAIQETEGLAATHNTERGRALREQFSELNDAAEARAAKEFGLGQGQTPEELAQTAGTNLQSKLAEVAAPSEQGFRQLDEALAPVKLTDDELLRISDRVKTRLQEHAAELGVPLQSGALDKALKLADATGVADASARSILKLSQNLGTYAHRSQTALGDIFGHETAALLREGQSALIDEIGGVLKRRGKDLGPEGLSQAKAVLDQFEAAKAGWAKYKETREPIAKLLGISNKTGRGGFEAALAELDPEKLATKLKNATKQQIDAVRAVSPETADAILRHKQAIFAQSAKVGSRDGLSLARLAKKYDDALASGKKYMFSPEQLETMRKIKTIQEAMPARLKNANPSGTSLSLQSSGLGKILRGVPFVGDIAAGLADEASDSIAHKLAQTAVDSAAIPATQKLMQDTGKMLKRVDKAITDTLKNAPKIQRARTKTGSVLERVLHDSKDKSGQDVSKMTPQQRMQEYARRSESFATNIEASQEKLDDAFGGFYHYGAPQAAGVAMNRATNAVNYLTSKLPPITQPTSPYDKSAPRVPDSQIAAFERRLEVVEDPGIIADRIADGTLSLEHVETLANVYPTVFGYIQQVVNDKLSKDGLKQMPYAQQLKLSMLLNLDLHPSANAQSIASFQQTFAQPQPDQMAQMGAGPSNSSEDSLAARTQTPSQRGQMG